MFRNMRETCREPSLCRSFNQYIQYWWCYIYMTLPISECIKFSLRTLILWHKQRSGIWFKVRLALKWIGKLFKGRGRGGQRTATGRKREELLSPCQSQLFTCLYCPPCKHKSCKILYMCFLSKWVTTLEKSGIQNGPIWYKNIWVK